MLRTRISTGVLIAGGAAVALLLAGCDDSSKSAAPTVPSIPGSSSSRGQPLPTTTEPPQSSTLQAQPQEQPAPSDGDAATGSDCKVADLNLRLGGGDAAAGTSYRAIVFTNKGSRTCTIQGFPGVSYVTGDDSHQVGPAAYRTGSKGAVVTLKPGDSAFADVGFVQVANFDPAVCKPTEGRGLRVCPPHDFDSLFLPNAGTGCTGTPPGNQLTVATVQPGTGPA